MVKISVLLPDREDARFCAYCKNKGHKKSTFIAHLIKEHLDNERIGAQGLPIRRPSAHRRYRNLLRREANTPKPVRKGA
jgi:hypothetical protein